MKKKNLRNRMIKSGVKTAIKKFQVELASNTGTANVQLNATTSAIDKAAAKGILHKNTANRKKARLARSLPKRWLSELPDRNTYPQEPLSL